MTNDLDLMVAMGKVADRCRYLEGHLDEMYSKKERVDDSVRDFFNGTPITVEKLPKAQGWHYTIRLRDATTGGSGHKTEAEALRAAVMRIGDLFLTGEDFYEDEEGR